MEADPVAPQLVVDVGDDFRVIGWEDLREKLVEVDFLPEMDEVLGRLEADEAATDNRDLPTL